MQKAFASVVSFHLRFVYKVTLLRRLVELHLHSRGLLSCYCPSNGFRFNAFSCLSDAFSFRKRCSICLVKRKWLISDSCAFSDERPGRLCFRSITQESALLWSFRFVSDIYRSETARHGFRGAGFASGFKSCRVVSDIYRGVKRNETVGSAQNGSGAL